MGCALDRAGSCVSTFSWILRRSSLEWEIEGSLCSDVQTSAVRELQEPALLVPDILWELDGSCNLTSESGRRWPLSSQLGARGAQARSQAILFVQVESCLDTCWWQGSGICF